MQNTVNFSDFQPDKFPLTPENILGLLVDHNKEWGVDPLRERRKSLLKYSKSLFVHLLFRAEKRRLNLDSVYDVEIGGRSFEVALNNPDDLICAVTLFTGPQQAHLVPHVDVKGWEKVAMFLHLCGQLPFAEEDLTEFKRSLYNLTPLDYQLHELFDNGEAAAFPVDIKEHIRIMEARLARCVGKETGWTVKTTFGSAKECIKLRSKNGPEHAFEYRWLFFCGNTHVTFSRAAPEKPTGSQAYRVLPAEPTALNKVKPELPTFWSFWSITSAVACFLFKASLKKIQCPERELAEYFCRLVAVNCGKAFKAALNNRPQSLGPLLPQVADAAKKHAGSETLRSFPRIPENDQEASKWAKEKRAERDAREDEARTDGWYQSEEETDDEEQTLGKRKSPEAQDEVASKRARPDE